MIYNFLQAPWVHEVEASAIILELIPVTSTFSWEPSPNPLVLSGDTLRGRMSLSRISKALARPLSIATYRPRPLLKFFIRCGMFKLRPV
jgi:hypothetical protein